MVSVSAMALVETSYSVSVTQSFVYFVLFIQPPKHYTELHNDRSLKVSNYVVCSTLTEDKFHL